MKTPLFTAFAAAALLGIAPLMAVGQEAFQDLRTDALPAGEGAVPKLRDLPQSTAEISPEMSNGQNPSAPKSNLNTISPHSHQPMVPFASPSATQIMPPQPTTSAPAPVTDTFPGKLDAPASSLPPSKLEDPQGNFQD